MNRPGDDFDELSSLFDEVGLGADERVARVMSAVPDPPPLLRIALWVLVLVQAPVVAGWLFNTDPFGLLGDMAADVHLARDGAFGLVIVAAAGITAWRPRWSVPAFSIASIALVAQLAAGFADDTITSSSWNEAVHLLLLVTTLSIGAAGLRLRPLAPTRNRPLFPVDDSSEEAGA